MIPTVNTDQVVNHTTRVARGRRLRWFFPVLSGVLLAALVVGFAPSFFLRGRITFTPPSRLSALAQRLASGDLPLYLIVHGVAVRLASVAAAAPAVGAGLRSRPDFRHRSLSTSLARDPCVNHHARSRGVRHGMALRDDIAALRKDLKNGCALSVSLRQFECSDM